MKKLFFAICMFILLLGFFAVVIRSFTRLVIIKKLGINNAITDAIFWDVPELTNSGSGIVDSSINIDWSVLYPFHEDRSPINVEKKVIDKTLMIINGIKDGVEKYTSDYLICYRRITELAQKYKSFVRWNYTPYSEYNGLIRTPDGYYTTIVEKKDMKACADQTVSFSDYCTNKGIKFLYVNTPVKLCKFYDNRISGISDFNNQNADSFLSLLDSQGITWLDLRTELHEDGFEHHSLFFKTDHHWRPETGLWAAERITTRLKDLYGLEIDSSILNPDYFTYETYPKWFLGSQGKKVTLANAEPEDFSLIYPKYPTLFSYEVKSKNIAVEGDFEVFYDMDQISNCDYYNLNPYTTYMYGDQALERIENKQIYNGLRVLIIRDSFSSCVLPFLALSFQYIDAIDLRHFNGSLKRFIEIEKPDVVIVIYNSNILQGPSIVDDGVFDFR